MASETSNHDAVMQLVNSTADAVSQVLQTLVGDDFVRAEATVLFDEQDPFDHLPLGGVAASVHYVDGITGANILLMPPAAARSLAAAMGVEASDDGSFSDLELSAVGEAANQMLAAATSAISVVIGQEIEISPPEVTVIDGRPGLTDDWGRAPFNGATSFVIGGESCRLVQLVPSAFVVRMARAMDDFGVTDGDAPPGGAVASSLPPAELLPLSERLTGVSLRFWAELGRTEIPIGAALELPAGAVVDLDRAADAPVDLFVNGLCFGQGQLLVTDDGEWAIEVTALQRPSVNRG